MTPEKNGNGNPLKQEGYYQHAKGGPIVYVGATPGLGTPLIDAYVSAGYVFLGTEDPSVKAEVVEAPVAPTGKEAKK